MIPIIHHPTPIIIAYAQQSISHTNNDGRLKLIEARKIWSNFAEISAIYRESGHNKEISDYLKTRLEKSGFNVIQKPDGTICASRGVNKSHDNAIILQSHMDIVGISADGNSQKPIKLHEKGGWLYANDRTLGADNGIGLAAMLTLADDAKFKDYPLEMIITTDEETGMTGARNLKPNDFYGKYLINLDSEEQGVITNGCAGIAQFNVSENIKMNSIDNDEYTKITIKLTGAKGGHSATIQVDSLNPIKVILSELKKMPEVNLISLSGGERYNAIPRDAQSEFLIHKSKDKSVLDLLNADLAKVKKQNAKQNPEFDFTINSEAAKKGTEYMDSAFQKRMIDALDEIPTGLLSKFEDISSTKTSQNLGVVKIANGKIYAQIMGRSSDLHEGQELQNKTSEILSELFNKQIDVADTTPIWQPKDDSFLEEVAFKAYSDTTGTKAFKNVEHGGLESAIFIQKKPDLDEISIGPTIEDPHSIKERVKIDTVLPFYSWLCQIIDLLTKN